MKDIYLKRALREANKIKRHATKEQIGRLNFKRLDPSNASKCIYGQMTGNCENGKAVRLIRMCAYTGESYRYVSGEANHVDAPRSIKHYSYSVLESCIMRFRNGNEALIDFIKGGRKLTAKQYIELCKSK